MATVIRTLVLAIVGVLTGWLAPAAAKSRRPYGLGGDIAAATVTVVVLGLLEWSWLMELAVFQDLAGWVKLAGSIGDPFVIALVVLWLMRRVGPEATD